jgi:hypothetical protein|tara:strand:- start:1610 stop:1759 length:150 start_codon:yes stop_codon:yes gene_type:complete
MKKDDVIILSCSVCKNMACGFKKNADDWAGNYRLKEEFILCRTCFGVLN